MFFCGSSKSGAINGGSTRVTSHSPSVQIKVANRLSNRRILGFLHLLFKLFRQDVFLIGFLKPGIREFVLALLLLLFENARSLCQVNVRPGLYVRLVRQHSAKYRINHQLGLAARASYVQIFAVFQSHGFIVLLRRKKQGARFLAPLVFEFCVLKDLERIAYRRFHAFAGLSPRVNPGAGRSSGRVTLGSVAGAPGGCGGGVRTFSGSALPSISMRTSLASSTSRSSSPWAVRSSTSRCVF